MILAALLAGLRGAENARASGTVSESAPGWRSRPVPRFSRSPAPCCKVSRGMVKLLEAVISVIAVIILLMVTNWVFHKYYWTGMECPPAGSAAKPPKSKRPPAGKTSLSLASVL